LKGGGVGITTPTPAFHHAFATFGERVS